MLGFTLYSKILYKYIKTFVWYKARTQSTGGRIFEYIFGHIHVGTYKYVDM